MKNNPKSESPARRILVLAAFGIAFGFIEAAVVVYLRGLFYPNGFSFPIAPFSKMPGATLFVLTETGAKPPRWCCWFLRLGSWPATFAAGWPCS